MSFTVQNVGLFESLIQDGNISDTTCLKKNCIVFIAWVASHIQVALATHCAINLNDYMGTAIYSRLLLITTNNYALRSMEVTSIK